MAKPTAKRNHSTIKALKIQIKGLVQGVGFRPFIYRLANEYGLFGWVENRNDGVIVQIEGSQIDLDSFVKNITQKAPEASNIEHITYFDIQPSHYPDFKIIKSHNISDDITEISPDIAVCSKCLEEMKSHEHRINYPFINCTNCGPRFSIIQDLPYDRELTTMSVFKMCSICMEEYKDILDRRFHAQPVACTNCGPHYTLHYNNNTENEIETILKQISDLLQLGKIITIKGLGGFFLACNALDDSAVKQLRLKKNREGKPFAVMFSSLEKLKEYAYVSDQESKILTSYRRPILLLKKKKSLAPSVTVGLNTIGAMLPYMPIHFLLFERLNLPAIVLTSGNFSEEPIIIDNDKAINNLSEISDAVLTFNRDIFNRTDDSVVYVVNDKERIGRRSRGYAPSPIETKIDINGIIAAGAELKNCFAVGKGKQAFLSQHIGDLKNLETYEFFIESLERYKKLFRITPELIACDLHPAYLSTQYAESTKLPIIRIQHHFAHIASCMAEHGLDEKVIGVSFDGTGYGDDGNIWGSEFFVCDLEEYERISHLEYLPLPGGDKASLEPWRMAVSYLYKIFKRDFFKLDLPIINTIEKEKIDFVTTAIEKKLNTPLTSSSGRLFDAVSSIIGLCHYNTFEAEGPIRLESIIDKRCNENYKYKIAKTIVLDDMIRGIVKDMINGILKEVISAKFHNTLISVIFDVVNQIHTTHKINKVVLSGGTFQNRYLLGKLELLLKEKLDVYSNEKIPTNDGGIALGQLLIAAKRRKSGCV
ncbi:carbamoyltransferase HypF [candidate division KSB1 bacterium]